MQPKKGGEWQTRINLYLFQLIKTQNSNNKCRNNCNSNNDTS